MIYLVTLATGALRLVASQQESLSGGALQFYVRAGSTGELRLNQAIAPTVWKDCRAIPDKEAKLLIEQGEAIVDQLVHKDLEGKLPKAPEPTPLPSQGRGAGGEGYNSSSRDSKPSQPKPEGWKNTTLGKDHLGRQVSLMWGRYGPFLKVEDKQTQESQVINLPNGEDYTQVGLTRAIEIIKAYKPKGRR